MSLEKYKPLIDESAKKYGVPRDVFYALLDKESGGKATAVSSKGARGLAQIMPATAKGYGVAEDQLDDPRTSIDLGARHLREMYNGVEKSLGDDESISQEEAWRRALAAYNGGGKGTDWGRNSLPTIENGKETMRTDRYADDILKRAKQHAQRMGGDAGVGAAPPTAAPASPPTNPPDEGWYPKSPEEMYRNLLMQVQGAPPEQGEPWTPGQAFQNLSGNIPRSPTFINDPTTQGIMQRFGIDPSDPRATGAAMELGLPLGAQPNAGPLGAATSALQGAGIGLGNLGVGAAGLGANLSNALFGTHLTPPAPLPPTQAMQVHPLAAGIGELAANLGLMMTGEGALAKAFPMSGLGAAAPILRSGAVFGGMGAVQPGAKDIEENVLNAARGMAEGAALSGVGHALSGLPLLPRVAGNAAAMPAIFGNQPVLPNLPIPGAAQQAIMGGLAGLAGGRSKTTNRPILPNAETAPPEPPALTPDEVIPPPPPPLQLEGRFPLPESRQLPLGGEPNWTIPNNPPVAAPAPPQEPIPVRQPTVASPPSPPAVEAPAASPPPPMSLAEIKARQTALATEFGNLVGKKLTPRDAARVEVLANQLEEIKAQLKNAPPEAPPTAAQASEVAPQQPPFVEESLAPASAPPAASRNLEEEAVADLGKSLEGTYGGTELPQWALEQPPPSHPSDYPVTGGEVRRGSLGDSHRKALLRYGTPGRNILDTRTNRIADIVDKAAQNGNTVRIVTDRREWTGDPSSLPRLTSKSDGKQYLFSDHQMMFPGDPEPIGVLGIRAVIEERPDGSSGLSWFRNDAPLINRARSAHALREIMLDQPITLETTSGQRIQVPPRVELRIHMDESGPIINLQHKDQPEPYAHIYPEDVAALYGPDGAQFWSPPVERHPNAKEGLLPITQVPRVAREKPLNDFLTVMGPNGIDLATAVGSFERSRLAQASPPPITNDTLPLDGQPATATIKGPSDIPVEKFPHTTQGAMLKAAREMIARINKLCGG